MNKAHFTLGLLLILANGQLLAQEVLKTLEERINEITYVFEGRVISSNSYETKNGGFINTSNTIQISRVFKGNLQCGTVEFITDGGDIGHRKVDISHNLDLHRGMTGIFLAKLTHKEMSPFDFYSESNNEQIEGSFGNQSFIKYWDDILRNKTLAFDMSEGNFEIEDLYSEITTITGYPMNPCSDYLFKPVEGFLKNRFVHRIVPFEHSTLPLNEMHLEETKEHNNTISKSLGSVDLTVSHLFSQEQLVTIIQGTDTSDWVELTIDMADDSSSVYLGYTQFHIEYDTATFGPNIWDATYSNLELERGNVFMNTLAYQHPSAYNLNDSTIVVNIFLEAAPQGRYDLSTNLEQALICRFKLKDCTPSPDFNFEVNDNIFYHTDPNTAVNIKYDFFQNNNWSLNSCAAGIPKIDSFVSSYDGAHTIRSGVFDTLRIYGSNFGDSFTAHANILFPNANDGGSTRHGLNSHNFDPILTLSGDTIIPWTDTLITILMPTFSRQYFAPSGSLQSSSPGSGVFYLVNKDSLFTSSPTGLTIKYSIMDEPLNRSTSILCATDSTEKGRKIKFRLDTEVANFANGQMKAVIEFALKEWSCKTGIDWELGSDTINLGAKEDSIFHICFIEDAVYVAQAPNYLYNRCPFNQYYYYDEFDIRISKTIAHRFVYDTTRTININASAIDFLAVIEHELGHGLRMNHMIDINDLMYYTVQQNATANQRHRIDGDCLEGGIYSCSKTFHSQDFVTLGCLNLLPPIQIHSLDSIKCSNTTALQSLPKQESVTIYPNPTESTIYIENQNKHKFDFELYNQIGQMMRFGKSRHRISLIGLTPGIYFLNLKHNDEIFTFKVVKL